ncbi:MAG: hypothetical protein NT024_00455, partial [Proteobacteria bacterium]|nr:hypothetical protein [Pseudomonadota bacterium]
TDTCDVAKQNAVATKIRDIVRAQLTQFPTIRYVQIIGGPDIVPPYYSPDETTISYEGLYASELFMLPGKPLGVALAEGYNPTDAFYASLNPKPFRGRELYIEDLPIGRLGETPSEILDAAQTFNSNNGTRITNTLATGYDFFSDGAQATASVLGGIATTDTSLIRDTWTAQDLRCKLLGKGTGCAVPDLAALNAHMSYNALLSANGFANQTLDTLASTETSSGLLAGRTTLSIGCHSGLNFPDAWAIPKVLAGLSFDPGRDWTQEPGTWVGPWTYGIGDDTVADRGTEGIMTLVTEELAKGRTLGDALVRAKQRYASGLFEFGVYDEKSLIGLGLFGMPQASFGITPSAAPSVATAATSTGSPVGTLELKLFECANGALPCTTPAAGAPFSYAIDRQSNLRGDWFTLAGDAQAVFGRPLLPSANYVDYLDLNPVFPTPQHDWTASVDEPQPCVETLSPTQLAVVSTLQVAANPLETLIVQSGQFRCTAAAGESVVGQMRIFDKLNMEALRPKTAAMNADFEPPTVLRQDVTASTATSDVTAILDAVDTSSNATPASGLREIIGLVFADDPSVPGGGFVNAVSTGDLSAQARPYRLVLPGARGKQLAFQYVDNAGNLLQKSLKGALITA